MNIIQGLHKNRRIILIGIVKDIFLMLEQSKYFKMQWQWNSDFMKQLSHAKVVVSIPMPPVSKT